MLGLIFKMSTALLWFTLALILALMLTSGWLRTNLAGEKKRDFGFDDLTTLPCSECLV
jgi:hypothetical protein